jgi:glycosyltransferase involved in cell wall biosynthesis
MIKRLRYRKWKKIIEKSGLFDVKYYLFTYPDVRLQDINPIMHYIKYGTYEGRNPSAEFDTNYYLETYEDVININPLVHYVLHGKLEKRARNKKELQYLEEYNLLINSKYFNKEYYLKSNPDLDKNLIDPVAHYILFGEKEGRKPNNNFEPKWYRDYYKDLSENNISLLVHYILHGENEKRFQNKKELEVFMQKKVEEKIRKSSANISRKEFIEYKEHEPLNTKLRTIAFYLPQFHPFPENDKWWGKGFTEWTNVTKAKPNFLGHYQPHLPIHNGFYDLRIPEVMIEQAKLAKNYGIYGFNFYYYWFDGKILMHKPFEILLKHKEIDINFCITWANENWTRRWDGAEHDILMGQNHCDEDSIKFIENLYKYFEDERYIRIDNKPVLIIYRVDIIPKMKETVELWRRKVKEAGFDGIYLICSQTFGIKSPVPYGFDAAMEFPPHTAQSAEITKNIDFTNQNFDGKVYDYNQVVSNAVTKEEPDYKLYRTAMLSWDNTARKQNASHIFESFSLLKYKQWISNLASNVYNNDKYQDNEKLIFINAWNEWAEGTHLEPDRKYGYGYLESTHSVIKDYNEKLQDIDIVIFVDKNNNLLESIKWFKEKTFLNIKLICFGDKKEFIEYQKYFDVKVFQDYSIDIYTLIENFKVKIKSIYIHENIINSQFIEKLERITIPVVYSTDLITLDNNFELKLLEILYKKTDLLPRVSVIVPTYNHAEFLEKRLDSIFEQTFQDFEVVLLDDNSKDNSQSILKEYTAKRPSVSYFFNKENSGTPFKQWSSGIEKARADIIWIAEDDDYAEKNFLEKLVPLFENKRTKLAYCQSKLIDERDNAIGDYKVIFSNVSNTKWNQNYNIAAFEEVQSSLAIRNTIPNASAVLFKKFSISSIIDELVEYKFAGDWFFYLNLLSEGDVSFVSEPLNYHRRHSQSTMALLSNDNQLYFKELYKIHEFILENFVLNEDSIIKMKEYIESELKYRGIQDTIDEYYPVNKLSYNKYKEQKRIAVFFSGYYFGGAEIFPINLANAFAELGHKTYLFDVGALETDERVRNMVSPLVSEVNIKDTTNSHKDLKDFLEKYEIDVINSQGWFATDFIQKSLTEYIRYIPWFASMHGHEENIITGSWGEHYFKYFDEAMKNTVRRNPYFIYTHEKNLEVFEHYPLKDKTKLIPLSELGMSSSLPEKKIKSQLNIDKDSFVLGLVARGIPEKGWEESIVAVRKLNEQYKLNVHLVCIGDSDYVQSLKKENDEEYIHFIGMSDEVLEWTQMFDVGLLPSFYKSESHPLVVMGYLLAGKPVITTSLGNIPEMIDSNGNKAGYLLKLQENGRPSSDEIAKYIKAYIENNDLYKNHSELALKAFEKFNMKNIANKYVDIFINKSKKKLYLHIGLPKTGTSAIQNFLINNEKLLKKEYDLYYPNFGRWCDGSHHKIAFALGSNPYERMKSDDEQKEYLDELEKDIYKSNCSRILLSSECFHLYNNKNFILKFKEKYEISIICYIRRQDEYLESIYGQNVRDIVYREKSDFNEFLNNFKENLYYSRILSKWEEFVDRKNIIVKVYDKMTFLNNNIIDDFMDIFSIKINSKLKTDFKFINTSYSPTVTLYKVLLNIILKEQKEELIYILQEYSNKNKEPMFSFFSDEERKSLIRIFEEDNELVRKKYTLLDNLFDFRIDNKSKKFLQENDIFDITNYLYKKNPKLFRNIFSSTKMNSANLKSKNIHKILQVIKSIEGNK